MDISAFEPISHEEIRTDIRSIFLGAIRMTLEMLLEEELRELIGVGRWQKALARKDRRNGSYMRQLMTSMGHLEVAVPRTRGSGSAGDVVGRYQRRTDEVDDAITSAYIQGVSTRKMGKVTAALMGESVSRSTVSRVTKSLEERVEALRKEPLTQRFPYLYLDATFLDARWARAVENVSALVAYGVGEDGHRRRLAISASPRTLGGTCYASCSTADLQVSNSSLPTATPGSPLQLAMRCLRRSFSAVPSTSPAMSWRRLRGAFARVSDAPPRPFSKPQASRRPGLGWKD